MAKAIMIQGTMSNAGKSLLAAGLCRIFKQDGYRVAPFKSQNMALNSYVTADGLEMGRAQVMQAEAAGIAPDVRMNPILLKPTNDTGSQVIVNGEILGDMDARSYFRYKKKLMPDVMKAFRELSDIYDIIVIEGAGSPAEINLKDDDLVNMGMAKASGAPVLLAGDIDRGGVFAQLYGTVALLEEDEQKLIKGLIINKFRGDKTLLDPGIAMLEEKVHIPVVGVIPYTRLDVDDEDSLSERLSGRELHSEEKLLDIAVIRLPHISNFTDLNVFSSLPHVDVRYVNDARELGKPDMVVLPGTKNTMGDMKWILHSGMKEAILAYHAEGGIVFGICGGYQMMGEFLDDPHGVEEGGSLEGIGLLPSKTVFTEDKRRAQMEGTILNIPGVFAPLSGMTIKGYEIHMGRTDALNDTVQPFTEIKNPHTGEERIDGLSSDRVYGTYVHGVFDARGIAGRIATILGERKGLTLSFPENEEIEQSAHKEEQYDILADAMRENMDIERVYRIMDQAAG
ncbi:MAG: cobyric acid synthase [Lachnospiraceae bacterium]|nr:cobyric acid synthase [Lachnospiraceae bacterium]